MLPKIVTPEYEITLPVKNEKIKIRPFLVSEEKILLLALESGEFSDITNAVRKIIQDCIVTPGIDVGKLPPVDVEFIFLQLRKRSINEEFEVGLKHRDIDENDENACKHVTKIKIKVDDIKFMMPENHTNKIMITDKIGIMMKYPSFDITNSIKSEQKTEILFDLIIKCMDQVFDEDNVTNVSDVPKEEIINWLGTLNQEQFYKISEFFSTMPYLYFDVDYVCEKCQKQEKYELKGLIDFFI